MDVVGGKAGFWPEGGDAHFRKNVALETIQNDAVVHGFDPHRSD